MASATSCASATGSQGPGDPRHVCADELSASGDGWAVESITTSTFEVNPVDGTTQVQAWLAATRHA